MAKPSTDVLLLAVSLLLIPTLCATKDTIKQSESLRDGDTIVSEGQSFAFGFFRPGNSKNKYLGIRYTDLNDSRLFWVANRETPITDSTGVLNISDDGTLILHQGSKPIWSSTTLSSRSPVALQILATGNLIVKDLASGQTLWQSFDYPTDTMLPNMNIGMDMKTGNNRMLNSWKSVDDPSPGEYSYGLRKGRGGSYELYLTAANGSIIYRPGPWNGLRFSGNIKFTDVASYINFRFVSSKEEVYYSFDITDSTIAMSWLVIKPDGYNERYVITKNQSWKSTVLWTRPTDACDIYNNCGKNGLCDNDHCGCFEGFRKSRVQGFLGTEQVGCERELKLNCSEGEGFQLVKDVKLPDTANATVDRNMSLDDCETKCIEDCSCIAYAAADISTGTGSGCIRWSGDLVDARKFTATGQDQLFLRLPASLLPAAQKNTDSRRRKSPVIAATVATVIGLLVLILVLYLEVRLRKRTWWIREVEIGLVNSFRSGAGKWEEDFYMFDYATIVSATKSFSDTIGKGGFGHVYKGTMGDGKEVAVKRQFNRTDDNEHGLDEFLNEATLIAKLQHRNLVRLLGCCTEGGERMLVYEYLPNKSLDTFIFDPSQREMLDWRTRTNIILGVARGVIYLHEDSRLKIIHRDLKAGNVLLDEAMNPKISDFGTARLFMADQSEDKTYNVIGTIGYISPEYAIDGTFSVKSDVFSFGVLMLEIISGMKNKNVANNKESSEEIKDKNLLSLAWRLWNEGNSIRLLDELIPNSCPGEVQRYVQIGLLCVQESADERPTMSQVHSMLTSEEKRLGEPNKPGIYQGRVSRVVQPHSTKSETVGHLTATVTDGR